MLPICAHCLSAPVKRRDKKYCSTTCRDAAARKPLPLCAAKCGRRVTRHQHRYCSLACGHTALRVVHQFCAAKCGQRVKQKKARFCSKSCAWEMRGGRAAAAKGRRRAVEVRRQQYAARLRERFKGMKSVAEVWKLAYARGYAACYHAMKRKEQRGEIVFLKPRRVKWEAA